MQDQGASSVQRADAAGQAGSAIVDDEPVTVPAYAGVLAARSPQRMRALRRHLIEAMRDAREMKRAGQVKREPAREPEGFRGDVARQACALCNGWCCSKGGDQAYLDERTMARVRQSRPELDARAVLRLYAEAAANPAYAGSCVFHGARGCTLDRSLRSDLCNAYFCNGLTAWLRRTDLPGEVAVITRSGATVRLRSGARES